MVRRDRGCQVLGCSPGARRLSPPAPKKSGYKRGRAFGLGPRGTSKPNTNNQSQLNPIQDYKFTKRPYSDPGDLLLK